MPVRPGTAGGNQNTGHMMQTGYKMAGAASSKGFVGTQAQSQLGHIGGPHGNQMSSVVDEIFVE